MVRRRRSLSAAAAGLWLAAFVGAPVLLLLLLSAASRTPYGDVAWEGWGAIGENWARALEPTYLAVIGRTIGFAAAAGALTAALGVPLAYHLARAPRRWQVLGLTAVIAPFLTNYVVRALALRAVFADDGWIPLGTGSPVAMTLGLAATYLPFQVLPAFASFARMDPRLEEAARDLGARGHQVWGRVLLPGARAGVATGLLFTTTAVLGEYVLPDLLSGSKAPLLGGVVSEQFLKARDWPFGAVLALLLLGLVLGTGRALGRAGRTA